MSHIRVMNDRPWWFYLGILACAAVLTFAGVKRMRYVYTGAIVMDTWTATACDSVTCTRIDALMDSVNARLPQSLPFHGVDTTKYSPDNPYAQRR